MSADTSSSLPEELLDLCCSYATPSSLCSLRLTNRHWHRSATNHLFSHITVKSSKENGGQWRPILDSPLISAVTSITFYTTDPTTYDSDEWDSDDYAASSESQEYNAGPYAMDENFEHILGHVGLFPNMQKIEMRFHWKCSFLRHIGEHETEYFRLCILRDLMQAINHQNHPAHKVHSLSIHNLQADIDYDLTDSVNFKKVVSQLKSLHLHIATQFEEDPSDKFNNDGGSHACFEEDLKDGWLDPVQNNLVSLSLSADINWGYYPHFQMEPENVYFPKLRVLSLGDVTFWQSSQLDWILSHKALRSMTLNDCRIIHASRMYCRGPGRQAPRYIDFSPDMNLRCWTNDDRWHMYFRRIKDELPQLTYFGVGTSLGHPDRVTHTVDRSTAPIAVDRTRYCLFDVNHGSGWSYPVLGSSETSQLCYQGDWAEGPRHPPDCNEEDRAALKELLLTVENRRRGKRI